MRLYNLFHSITFAFYYQKSTGTKAEKLHILYWNTSSLPEASLGWVYFHQGYTDKPCSQGSHSGQLDKGYTVVLGSFLYRCTDQCWGCRTYAVLHAGHTYTSGTAGSYSILADSYYTFDQHSYPYTGKFHLECNLLRWSLVQNIHMLNGKSESCLNFRYRTKLADVILSQGKLA